MKHLFILGALLLAVLISGSAHAGGYAYVNSGNNDGAGSLRSALESGAGIIRISRYIDTISISEPLVYDSDSRLRIFGSGQTVDGSAIDANENILSITSGADLQISRLSFIGSSNEVNNDPNVPLSGKGIFVRVPGDREGIVSVRLSDVAVTRVANHGVHISDCNLGDDCGSGSGGGGDGSAASINVQLNHVLINKVGFGKADADGIRVDDRGEGSIYFSAQNSTFINVGADGIELDEGDEGDVVVDVWNSLFDSNGEYCNLVDSFVGGACDDDGERDVDDGFDIDEAGAGTLFARIRNSRVTNNFDEGLDFDEEGDDGIEVSLTRVYAAGNSDEGIKMSEEDNGDVKVYMRGVTSVDNNGGSEGIELEEEDNGNAEIVISQINMIGGEDEELKLEQKDDGIGTVKVRRSNAVLDLDGVEEI